MYTYIHIESNAPPKIIKHIPISIENLPSNLYSNKKLFHESTTHYEESFQLSVYNKKLTYKHTDTKQQKHRNHKRKTIWFKQPFSESVWTKIGKSFLIMRDLNFPKNHIYNSIFNRNKIILSCSCEQNMESVIYNQNLKLLNNIAKIKESCKCRNRNNCPLDGKCQTPNINYKAKITSNQSNYKKEIHIDIAETNFKYRFNNHMKFFTLKQYENNTELYKECWKVQPFHTKNTPGEYSEMCTVQLTQNKKFYLVLNAKLRITSYNGDNLLNKRSELINKWRYQNKFLARNKSYAFTENISQYSHQSSLFYLHG